MLEFLCNLFEPIRGQFKLALLQKPCYSYQFLATIQNFLINFRHIETRNNSMTWSKTQTLRRNSPEKVSEWPLIRSKSLRSSFQLKLRKKSRKSSSDIANANKQEMQKMVQKDENQVVAKPEKIETEEVLSDKKQQRPKGSCCKNCCVISWD